MIIKFDIMKISIDNNSELVIAAQKATGITDLKELVEKALELLISIESRTRLTDGSTDV
ncbi:MAG: hypothetical protein JWR50_1114 [Mucilaginibacter sp.]|nr:hypothetical protein [Mucilaginibacter sp.]